jgi:hypothetical protein
MDRQFDLGDLATSATSAILATVSSEAQRIDQGSAEIASTKEESTELASPFW